MQFPVVLKGMLQLLIKQAEVELGPQKGPEKKKWVLDKLRSALVDAKWAPWLIEVVVSITGVVLDFLVKEALELLGK